MLYTRRAFLGALVARVITIPAKSMPRATVEADLIRALTEDIDDLHVDLVDLKLRRKIDRLMAKLSAED